MSSSRTDATDLILPTLDPTAADVAVAAPGDGDGFWAGGPSAAVDDDDTVWLSYRLRRPVGEGRGYAVAIARSNDGVHFDEQLRLARDEFACDSLERPSLVRRPDGGWRLYLSLATPGTLHWRIVALDADTPDGFRAASAVTVLDGGPELAYKDPVIQSGPERWDMWVCLHQIADPGQADAMTTLHATSADGLGWTVGDTVLAPDATSTWDRRGTRIASVVDVGPTKLAYFDGRASYEENWEERTGVAILNAKGTFDAVAGDPFAQSPFGSGCLRYVDVVDTRDGVRVYYEMSRADGAHDLVTELVSWPTAGNASPEVRAQAESSSASGVAG